MTQDELAKKVKGTQGYISQLESGAKKDIGQGGGPARGSLGHLDREQLKRECADALEALHRTQSVDGLAVVADSLRALGPTYRF